MSDNVNTSQDSQPNTVVVNGVRYKISYSYGPLAYPLMTVKFAGPVGDAALQKVLGQHYNQVVIYNHTTGVLSPKKYNGHELQWDALSHKYASRFKKRFDIMLEPYNIELVATLLKQVKDKKGAVEYEWTKHPDENVMDKNGLSMVANFVVRDSYNGNLRLLSPTDWLRVDCPGPLTFAFDGDDVGLLVRNCMHRFMLFAPIGGCIMVPIFNKVLGRTR